VTGPSKKSEYYHDPFKNTVELPIRVEPTKARTFGTLGLGLLVALVVGSTIGSGIFGLRRTWRQVQMRS